MKRIPIAALCLLCISAAPPEVGVQSEPATVGPLVVLFALIPLFFVPVLATSGVGKYGVLAVLQPIVIVLLIALVLFLLLRTELKRALLLLIIPALYIVTTFGTNLVGLFIARVLGSG